MIWTIARKEFLEKILDFRVIISFVIAIVLTVIATLVAGGEYDAKKAEYDKLVTQNEQLLRSVKVYSQFNPTVFYPPSPLSVFSQGIDIPTPITVDIQIGKVPRYEARTAGSNPMMSMFDKLDIATAIRILFSLLVILLTFDAFSGEKENGTLRQALSNPVARVNLLYGKFVGTLLVLGVVVVLTFLVALISLQLSSGIGFETNDLLRIALIAIATLLYLAVFAALGMFASIAFHHSSTSLAVLLFVWFCIAILQPNVNTYISSGIEGTGWIRNAQSALRNDDCGVEEELARLQQERGSFMFGGTKRGYYTAPGHSVVSGNGRYYMYPIITDADYDILDYTMQQVRLLRKEGDCAEREYEKYRTFYLSHLDKQLKVKQMLDLLSPSALFSRGAAILSRTDIQDVDDFFQQVQQYREHYTLYLDQKGVYSTNAQLYFSRLTSDQIDRTATEQRMARYEKDASSIPYIEDQPPLDLRDAPVFSVHPSDLGKDLGAAARTLVPIPSYFALLFFLSGWKLKSFDPR